MVDCMKMFNLAKLTILEPEWIELRNKVAKEKKNLVNSDQSFMEKLHTHGDKIGRIPLHPLINILCVIQWGYK